MTTTLPTSFDEDTEVSGVNALQIGACEVCVCLDSALCSCCHLEPCQVQEYPDMWEIWLAAEVHAEAHYANGTHPDDCSGPDCPLNRCEDAEVAA